MKKIIPSDANLLPDKAKLVFKGKIFDVYQYDQELYDGSHAVFEMLKRPDTVQVLAVVDDKIIVLEDEQPHREMVLALPGGRVDESDGTTLDAAKREAHEETGYSFSNWKLLDVVKPQEKIEWFIYTYLAWGHYQTDEAHIDGGEKIKVLFNSYDEIKELQKNESKRFIDLSVVRSSEKLEDLINTPEYKGVEVNR